jgi:hypothetical protein
MVEISTLLKHEDLFLTEFPNGTSFYWRLLSLREYYLFKTLLNSDPYAFDIYMQIFKQAVLLEAELINPRLPLGYFVSVAKAIMYLSGDGSQETLQDEVVLAKQLYPSNSIDEIMKGRIYTAFPTYTPKDLMNMSRSQIIRLFAQAENVLATRIQGFQPVDFSQVKYKDDNSSRTSETPISIDFDQDAALQRQQLHPWEAFEEPSESPVGISRSVARKLDARRNLQS